jgi:hypothetical protein
MLTVVYRLWVLIKEGVVTIEERLKKHRGYLVRQVASYDYLFKKMGTIEHQAGLVACQNALLDFDNTFPKEIFDL